MFNIGVGDDLLRVFDAYDGTTLGKGVDDYSVTSLTLGDFDADSEIESVFVVSGELQVWDLSNDAGTLHIGGWVNITVHVEDNEGNSAEDFIIIDITDVDAPTAPSITDYSANESSVDITWSESSTAGIVGYEIYRGNNTYPSPHSMDPIAEVSSETTDFTDEPLLQGRYHYCVIAIDPDGVRSARSNVVELLVGNIPDWDSIGGPEAPWGLRIERGPYDVTLKWNLPNSDIVGIRVYRGNTTIEDTSVGVYQELGATITEYTQVLSESEGYWYALTSIDSEGTESPLSVSIYSGTYVESDGSSSTTTGTTSPTGGSFLDYLLQPTTLIIIAVVVIIVLVVLFRN